MCVTHMVRDLQKILYMVRGLPVSDDLLAIQEQLRPLRGRVHNICVTHVLPDSQKNISVVLYMCGS